MENEDINTLMKNYEKNKKNYKTNPIITKYEKTRLYQKEQVKLIWVQQYL